MHRAQAAVAAGVIALGAAMAAGASQIPSEAGYAGVGPNFLPWLVAVALLGCGAWLLKDALRREGWQPPPAPDGDEATGGESARPDWRAAAWVSAGVLSTALLITRIGFVLACALAFALAVRGLRMSEGKPGGNATAALRDLAIGLAISLPVHALFHRLLGINLPTLVAGGWL